MKSRPRYEYDEGHDAKHAAWRRKCDAARNVEVWVTSIHNGQLVYERHSVHQTYAYAQAAAMNEGHAVRTMLVELKHDGKVLWTVAPDRRGRAYARLYEAGFIDEDGHLVDDDDD